MREYIITIKPGRWSCSCGEGETNLLTGTQAQRHGYWHGTNNHIAMFRLEDRRTCSTPCMRQDGMGEHAEELVWHHPKCPNHTTRCCGINDPEDDV